MSARPRRLVVVFGTATDVGKTWVSCRMLESARAAGLTVVARKPAQSFAPPAVGPLPRVDAVFDAEVRQWSPSPGAGPAAMGRLPRVDDVFDADVRQLTAGGGPGWGTDAEVLAAVTGELPTDVCPAHRWYPAAVAPPMAATWLGRPDIAVGDLAAEIVWPPGVDVGLVETAGGPRSPLAHDGDGVALAELLQPDLAVLVADAALGTINAVRLAVAAIAPTQVVVVLNRFDPADPLHAANLAWLSDVDGLTVATDPAVVLTPMA